MRFSWWRSKSSLKDFIFRIGEFIKMKNKQSESKINSIKDQLFKMAKRKSSSLVWHKKKTFGTKATRKLTNLTQNILESMVQFYANYSQLRRNIVHIILLSINEGTLKACKLFLNSLSVVLLSLQFYLFSFSHFCINIKFKTRTISSAFFA